MIPMDDKLRYVVKLFSYPVWFVVCDPKVDCTCINFPTQQADYGCKKCLGTGKKIKLIRENAACQNQDLSQRGEGMGYGEQVVVSEYYCLRPVNVHLGDYIINGDNVDVVQRIYPERTNHGEPVYYRYVTSPLKAYSVVILNNFREILKEHGYV